MSRAVLVLALVVAGCGPSVYPYLATNDDCSCELYRAIDEQSGVMYSFAASYSLRDVMNTRITVSIQNTGHDTLDLSLAYIKITSRNFPYQYNDKFLPVAVPDVPPGDTRLIHLDGEVDMSGMPDPWLAIAGEELVVTLKGMQAGRKPVASRVVHLVPRNPKLS
jgi:hypothetical protein